MRPEAQDAPLEEHDSASSSSRPDRRRGGFPGFLLWEQAIPVQRHHESPQEQGDSVHRPFRVREVHAAALYQPDE